MSAKKVGRKISRYKKVGRKNRQNNKPVYKKVGMKTKPVYNKAGI